MLVGGSVGMADELDSGSSVGNYVWVQVPSSAVGIHRLRREIVWVFLFHML